MKLKPHVSLAGSSTNSPFRVFLSTRGPKIAQAWQKSVGVKTLTIWVCEKIWGRYIIFKAMYVDKWLWPIFGCKVDQSVQIGMKLELDVWHHPLDVYAKFQTDISKHVKKSPENFSLAGSSSNTPFQVFFFRQRAKNCPTMTKISRDQDTRNISMCTKSEASIWFLRPLTQINDFDLFLVVK